MQELKKKHNEILALYKLESGIADLYVEGNNDKAFIENFLATKKVNRKIIPIEIVDFSELPIEYFENLDINSNKTKVIILSKLLTENLPATKVNCIVDKDFDDYIKTLTNGKLLKTDFSCLESYLFCDEVVEKFLKIGIGNFPFNSKFILRQLATVLKPLFCLRLLTEIHYRSAQLVAIDGNLSINRQNGTINFSKEEYLNKFMLKNSLIDEKDKINQLFNDLFGNLKIDIRDCIHGHDFIDIFFLYVNKIKNTSKFKEENFGKSLFLTVESSMIENFPLFKGLVA